MALEGQIEAYNLPLGVVSHLYREIAAHAPGRITKVGLRTFVDPRLEGGKLNAATTRGPRQLVELGGEEWLHYKAFPINVALIRGTTADPAGNITMEREALTLDNLAAAMAAKNSGGFVIAQVERMRRGWLARPARGAGAGRAGRLRRARQPENHRQTYGTPYNHAFSGRQRVPLDRIAAAAARRAQDHRPALRLRAAARRRGQSRHRHARGRRGGRRRGAGAAST